ncbi:MAG TPA: nuclear transport factor 2 family protein [Xanthobacteraceae bacterium]|nr:nuclear transport factor 2 family protein [Xanthobacteraceae bacterium]
MPTRARVDAFVATVVSNDHVKAIEDFYWEDASMQENSQPPRCGRDASIAQEQAFLERVRVFTHPPRAVLVDGDHVAIFWVFDITDSSNVTRRREELALQTWRDERIQSERFFYDPAETMPIPSASGQIL